MGCMPEPVKSVDGSLSGIKEAEGIITWPLDLKKSRYLFLNWFVVIDRILFFPPQADQPLAGAELISGDHTVYARKRVINNKAKSSAIESNTAITS